MKRIIMGVGLACLLAAPGGAQAALRDRTAEGALLTWRDPHPWQAGVVYSRIQRPMEINKQEFDFRGDVIDAYVGVAPFGWLLLYGQAGASQAELKDWMADSASFGAGGLLGMRVNLWEIDQGVENTAWRFTVKLAAQYAYRTTADDDEVGKLSWGEALVMLPLDYHLFLARRAHSSFTEEFHSISLFAGPAFSKVDGEWEWNNTTVDFEEKESFGAVLGVKMWLIESLMFEGRADWFDDISFQISMTYLF